MIVTANSHYLLVLTNLVYPAALTASVVAANAYVLDNRIDNLEDRIEEMKGDIKVLKHGAIRLAARISVAEKLLKDCGKNR